MVRRLLLLIALTAGTFGLPTAPASGEVAASSSCTISGTIFPGSSLYKRCTIFSLGPVDAVFYVWVNPDSIVVRDASDNTVSGSQRDTFIGFFRYSLSRERFVTTKNPTGVGDVDVARVPYPHYGKTCDSRTFSEVGSFATSCLVGRIRQQGVNFDSRSLEVELHMRDDGDQTAFAGWSLEWTEVFTACVGTSCPQQNGTPLDEI